MAYRRKAVIKARALPWLTRREMQRKELTQITRDLVTELGTDSPNWKLVKENTDALQKLAERGIRSRAGKIAWATRRANDAKKLPETAKARKAGVNL